MKRFWLEYILLFAMHLFLLLSESRNTYKICNQEETLFVQLSLFFFQFFVFYFQIANYLPLDEDLNYPSKLERSDINLETTSVSSFLLQLISFLKEKVLFFLFSNSLCLSLLSYMLFITKRSCWSSLWIVISITLSQVFNFFLMYYYWPNQVS